MDFLNDDWLLDVVNDLKIGESTTIKNKGTGILKVHKYCMCISISISYKLRYIRLEIQFFDYFNLFHL